MFKTSSAIASGHSGHEATKEALNDALSRIDSDSLIGALIFASSKLDQQEVVDTAREILGENVPFAGASTAGEISQAGPSKASSVSVMLMASDSISCTTTLVEDVSGNEDARGAELAEHLNAAGPNEQMKLITIFGDGLKVNPNGILRGIGSVLPGIPVTGGSAGDDGQYKSTYQYCDGKLVTNGVSALAFRGNLKVAIGVRHGWSPISGLRTVTKSEGAVVHEIDGKSAISLYEEFIGDEAEKLKEVTLAEIALSYPVGLIDNVSREMVLRAPFYVDANGSITFGGEVPEGSEIQLMMGTKDQAVQAAKEAGESAMKTLGTKPAGTIIYSCHVRDTLYESRDESKREIDAIQEATGSDVPLAGFYTYAEQAPIDAENLNVKTCDTANNNETIVAILLAEDNASA